MIRRPFYNEACETCLNTNVKLEHCSVKHPSSNNTSRVLARARVEFEFESLI